MASSRMISCRIFWINISLPGRTLSPAMPGREPPKPIRNQIASIIHEDEEVTHIYLRKYTFIHFGISIPVAFEFIPFRHAGGRIPEQERSRCSRYHRQVKHRQARHFKWCGWDRIIWPDPKLLFASLFVTGSCWNNVTTWQWSAKYRNFSINQSDSSHNYTLFLNWTVQFFSAFFGLRHSPSPLGGKSILQTPSLKGWADKPNLYTPI